MTETNLELLSKISAHSTSLISIYVQSNYPIWLVHNKINQEMKTAYNIKDKSVSKNVITGFKYIANRLKNMKKIGENGLVIFSSVYNEQYL